MVTRLDDTLASMVAERASAGAAADESPGRVVDIGSRRRRVAGIGLLAAASVVVAGVAQGAFTTTDPRPVASAVLNLCISVVDPLPEMGASVDEVIELHQRLAAALYNTESKASTARGTT